jgi:hypothetical protein
LGYLQPGLQCQTPFSGLTGIFKRPEIWTLASQILCQLLTSIASSDPRKPMGQLMALMDTCFNAHLRQQMALVQLF